jgi:DNA-binding transcriptional regulator GbsR (MarR family)
VDDRERQRAQRLLVEEYGLLLEEMGGTRMEGRVLAWLLLADAPEQSLTEIAAGLGVSKAAVSTAARSLLQARAVERVSEPGRRGDSYRSTPGKLEAILRLDHVTAMRELVDRGLELVDGRDQTQSNYAMLHEMHDFLDFLEAEIPGLMSRWLARRAANPTTKAGDGPTTPHTGGTP